MRRVFLVLATLALAVVLSGCGGGDDAGTAQTAGTVQTTTTSSDAAIDRVVNVDGERGLYLRCSGTGSPTVVMEGGDEDTSASYAFAERRLAAVTRTCVYDRANLGRSDAAPGPRGFTDLVEDLDRLLANADVPEPYVLVGTSGGGYIVAGYAFAQPTQIAGMAFIDVPTPSATHRHRSWKKRSGTTPRTSSDATISRSRRTLGQHEKRLVTSRSRSSATPTATPRSRRRRSRPSAEGCERMSRINEAG